MVATDRSPSRLKSASGGGTGCFLPFDLSRSRSEKASLNQEAIIKSAVLLSCASSFTVVKVPVLGCQHDSTACPVEELHEKLLWEALIFQNIPHIGQEILIYHGNHPFCLGSVRDNSLERHHGLLCLMDLHN
jgi:hypothetical protein